MKVVVAGGTGLLGREITKVLLDHGHDVIVTSRSQPTKEPLDPRAKWAKGDVTDPESLVPALSGAHAVVDAVQFPNSPIENPKKGFTFEKIDLNGTKNLVDAAKKANVGLFIGLSGAGSEENARYHWQRFKWQEEQHIKSSGVPYVIFRPSWIYGPRDVSLNRFLGFAKILPFIPIIGDGKTRINPLFVGDLAQHVAAALKLDSARGQIFEIGGPEVLTMNDVVRTALKVTGKKRFLFPQPKPLMKLIATFAQFAPGRPLTPDAIDFITMDGVADTTALQKTFGLPLTSLKDGLKSYVG
jgi:uncharacterized protein YbjT (DUF2867 family)